MRLLGLVPLAALLLSNAPAAPARRPLPAPPQFLTGLHALTFHSPAGSTYCPLPSDWVGSDHGTTLFLTPPARCGGAGFASGSRGWTGAGAARIDVYYGYWMGDDISGPKPCNRIGSVRLLGKDRPLCRRKEKGVVIEASARFTGDSDSEVVLTLVTNPKRLAADLATLRTLAASARTCSGMGHSYDLHGREVGKPTPFGRGAPCPAGAKFF
jgi:hypothetical protein